MPGRVVGWAGSQPFHKQRPKRAFRVESARRSELFESSHPAQRAFRVESPGVASNRRVQVPSGANSGPVTQQDKQQTSRANQQGNTRVVTQQSTSQASPFERPRESSGALSVSESSRSTGESTRSMGDTRIETASRVAPFDTRRIVAIRSTRSIPHRTRSHCIQARSGTTSPTRRVTGKAAFEEASLPPRVAQQSKSKAAPRVHMYKTNYGQVESGHVRYTLCYGVSTARR